jgi:hypothetical protein
VSTKLPLDSPHWASLTAASSPDTVLDLLREIVATGQLGDTWDVLQDEILDQGDVYTAAPAVLPHVIDVAAGLDPATLAGFWTDIGFVVTAGGGRFTEPPAPGLREGLAESLQLAEQLAVRSFLATEGSTASELSYHALACLGLGGHPTGSALWDFLAPGEGYVRADCPGCGAEWEIDGFGDPLHPPCEPPPVPRFAPAPAGSAWPEVAARLTGFGPGWAGFVDVAGALAAAAVPDEASNRELWCLVAAMVAAKGEVEWARTLARLIGHFECGECGEVFALADAIGDEAVTGEAAPPGTVVTADANGFRLVAAPSIVDGSGVEPVWRGDGGPVDAVALVAADVLASGGPDGTVTVWNHGGGLATRVGAVTCLATLPLPDGSVVLAVGGASGAVDWWDPATGQPLGEPENGAVPITAMAPIAMPDDRCDRATGWLAELRDGRVLLATGDAEGAVRLWDPVSRQPLGQVYRREGRPVVALSVVDLRDLPHWDGGDLVALYGDRTVDIWSSAAVFGEPSTMAPAAEKLAAAGHEHLIAVAVAHRVEGHKFPVLLADRNGTVTRWETFGVRLGDPLPPDPAHDDVVGIATVGGLVVTASAANRNLRLWRPDTGGTRLVSLDVTPRCLLGYGSRVAVGHDKGVLSLAVRAEA